MGNNTFDINKHTQLLADYVVKTMLRQLKEHNDYITLIKPFIQMPPSDLKITSIDDICDYMCRNTTAKIASHIYKIFDNIKKVLYKEWIDKWMEFNNCPLNRQQAPYKHFIKNLKDNHGLNTDLKYYLTFVMEREEYFFLNAFCFDYTKQGLDYWYRMERAFLILMPPALLSSVAQKRNFFEEYDNTHVSVF